jgi:hypothetical protein
MSKDSVKVIIEEGLQNTWTESEHLARPGTSFSQLLHGIIIDRYHSSCTPAKMHIGKFCKGECRDVRVFLKTALKYVGYINGG